MARTESNDPTSPNSSGPQQQQDRRIEHCSRAWNKALEQGTAVIRQSQQQRQQHNDNANDNDSNGNNLDQLQRSFEECYNYLGQCQAKLQSLKKYWSEPPRGLPPKASFRTGNDNNDTLSDPFVTILPLRRLLIRILTAQSDVLTVQVLRCSVPRTRRNPGEWLRGAQLYELALDHIHEALTLADQAYAQFFLEGEEKEETNIDDEAGDSFPQQQQQQAMEQEQQLTAYQQDAQIVSVAIQSLTEGRDGLLTKARQHAGKLRRRLEPQWDSRDEVRDKMGVDRWNNNPRPKMDYAKLRAQDERALRQVDKAIAQLEGLHIPAQVGALMLSTAEQQQQSTLDNSSGNRRPAGKMQRYNGQRPTDTSRRVSWQDYPDPADFGWIFTGSWNNYVEFFQKPMDDNNNENDNDDDLICKLDWYFTTGTVKTSLLHPRQGKRTQLFGNRCTPPVYRAILEQPRVHTNERYHTTNQKKGAPNNNRNKNPRGRQTNERGGGGRRNEFVGE
mmetsp:Transcript_5802/g.16281  ORF Transcript_5802/g.16281 Transcript_5802/m.16281 type:complete len:502 (-) Transcript_5802:89-1594(-)|eukprot:CAMPEP_0168748066 /NCGR_PEP_ID=MMETSP0724-20121128/15984_1 /TAXON_ID=265536 /ORGANISM="Amphiprora sp., Strain CCMP467" /LENGTH=501 /DNA_ID=CAMNT_0008795883 /DNA_START=87 /DNA_END=1592 /DNA_ORIENTATION=+